MCSYHIWRAWYSGSYTMMAKPIRALELLYPVIQFLIINLTVFTVLFCVVVLNEPYLQNYEKRVL